LRGLYPLRNKWWAFLLLVLFALVLYLPFLGAKEFKGEEGRRVLIALEMLEKGDFWVPSILGRPYLMKPPLFNWVLALAFKVSGSFSEFTARLVSSISAILTALFLSLIWMEVLRKEDPPPFSGKEPSWWIVLLPGLIYLTIPQVIDKALLAEIEAFYALLVTLSLYLWFYLFEVKGRRDLGFFVAGCFSGLAVLTKTFQALLFFYLPVILYLRKRHSLKLLFTRGHLLFFGGLLLVFGAWSVPVSLKVGFKPFLQAWLAEYLGNLRTKGTLGEHLSVYTMDALLYFSPWLLFLWLWVKRENLELLRSYPLLFRLGEFSAFLFVGAYFFHFFIPASRLRYIFPATSGLAFPSALLFLLMPKILGFSSKKVFIFLISLLFLSKHAYTLYSKEKNPHYFQNLSLQLASELSGEKVLYLCEIAPPYLIYYLKYKYQVVKEIKYLESCKEIPPHGFVLAPRKEGLSKQLSHPLKVIPFKIRSDEYLLFKGG
jgi:4-amino-4-deoxy-L-arabinose transferase-like glycosyltransferase